MLKLLIVSVVATGASMLTFFTGFGLGTVLLPVLILFFPAAIAVSVTAIVHLLNSLFKALLTWQHARWKVAFSFGLPAMVAAIAGAQLLLLLTGLKPLYAYSAWGREFAVTPVKLTIAVLLISFVFLEAHPAARKLAIDEKFLPLGGLVSGFFGGLSGHQGAFRSLFLIKSKLDAAEFVATGAVIAAMVDITRLAVYVPLLSRFAWGDNGLVVVVGCCAAFAGALLGNFWLKKVTIAGVQIAVSVCLALIGVALSTGLI